MPSLRLVRERRAAGLCVQCGQKAWKTFRFCKAHREAHNRAQNTAQKKRIQARKEAGLCVIAGCKKPLATSWYCRPHQDWYNAWRRRKRG